MLASAQTVAIDGVCYTLYGNYAKVVNNSQGYRGDVVIPDVVTYNGVEYPVTRIGYWAFSNCDFNSLYIGKNVESIESQAFVNYGISSITVDMDNPIYDSRDNCNAIIYTRTNELTIGCKNTIIPNSVTSIGYYAFFTPKGLTSITIPRSVNNINNYAFKDCFDLTSIQVSGGNTTYDSRNNCNAIIKTATNELIIGCSATVIPNSVLKIGNSAFEYCWGLTTLVIPEGVTTIGNIAFKDCTGLTSVNIPKSVTSIDTNPFSNCKNLTSIVVESGNTVYDSRENCNAIIETGTNKLISGCENTIIPNGVLSIGAEAFKGCEGLAAITIPEGVTGIDRDAFYWCRNLSSISVPNSVTSIGDMAFYGCHKVTSINIPEGLTKIGYSSYYGCEGLTTITIPSSVTNIDNYGFANCKGLTDVYCYAENVPAIAKDIFIDSNQENVILHVPAASVQMYKKAPQWNSFKDIVALDNSDKSALCYRGKFVKTGSTIIQNAEDWASGGEGSNNQETGMYVFVNNGNDLTKTAKLEIQENTLNAGSLKWSIGGDTYDLNNVTTLEKNFSTDENGIAFVKFIAGEKATEGNFQAKLTITVEDESKSYMIHAKPFGDLGVPLTFEAVDGTVTVKIMNYYCSLMPTMQYSIDGGPWTDFTLSNNDCHGTGFANKLPAGKIVQLRGNEWYGGFWESDHFEINCDDDCYVYGNVCSLDKGEDFATNNEEAGRYGFLFKDNTHIKNHPTKDLILPSTTLIERCYAGMFKGCTGLTRAPKLPATTLAEECYTNMFMGCTNLTEAPELPATKLEKWCYVGMFFECPNLKYVKCLATENIVEGDDTGISSAKGYIWFDDVDNGTVTSWLKDAGTNITGTKTFIVNESLTITGDDPLTATVENWGERSVSGIPEGWTLGNLKGERESITISSAKQVTYMSDKDLDFTGFPDLKAYVATGYDKGSGTIWLTRVKEVPANTGFLLMGEADTYDIPVTSGGSSSYYMNLFKGTIEGTTIQTTEGDYTNYYLSNGDAGVGFYKVTKAEGVALAANRAYLSVPTEIPVVGATGSTETIKVSAAGQVPYYNSQSLDFSSLDAQGVKAYTATGYDYSSGTIWLTRVKQVPAETGILIMAPQGEYPVPTASVASVYANMFKGTLTGTTIQTHETIAGEDYINYYLSSGDAGVGFYKVTKEGGVSIGANRCYLPIKNKEAAGTRSAGSGQNQIAFEEADEVIGIPLFRGIGDENGETTNLTPALSKGEGDGEWYTLQGQRVAKPGKGLYIRNGKVVVIK